MNNFLCENILVNTISLCLKFKVIKNVVVCKIERDVVIVVKT